MPHIFKTQELAAQAVARRRGVSGKQGGWIYGPAQGPRKVQTIICQGWFNYAARLRSRGVIVGDWKQGFTIVEEKV